MMTKEGSAKIVNFMTPRAGDRSCARVWPYKSYSENALFLEKSSSLFPGKDQTNQVCSSDDQGRVYQNCKFHDPSGRGSCARVWPYKSYSETALFLLKSSSLFSGIDQTNQVYSNDDQGRVYQNCKFHDPWGRGSCARVWQYKSYSETALFL